MSVVTKWTDTKAGYGVVSRVLHWAMALLFAVQFTSALLHFFASDTPIEGFFWSSHVAVGFSLLVLVIIRAAWGLYNLGNRPPHAPTLLGRAAAAGHLALYALMLIIPALAVARAYGSGRGFAPLGIQIFEATGVKLEAYMAPANALHGLLGWALLLLVVGHIGMVLVHRFVWKDDVLGRMAKL